MNTKGYIAKKKKGSGLYEELHLEALEVLQKLSGAVWTDYNEHDPGVTLLENISYAITELAHKTKIPIQDLLIQSKGKELNSGDNAFFTPSDILTTDAISFNDYRKIWIDKVTNVKNIWIYPVDSCDGEVNNIKGLLHIFVEKYEYQSDGDKENEENEKIIQEIKNIYYNHRNLCEDLYKVEIYTPLELTMEFEIALSDESDSEEILASIYHKVNDYLAPEVKYYSLWKLQQEKVPVNEIFNGPRLSNGFIQDEDLTEPLHQIVVPEIVKIISRIPGIVNIINFCLHYTSQETKEKIVIQDVFDLPQNTTALVLFPKSDDRLVFENSGVLFRPDLNEARKQLSFIQAIDYGGFKAASNSLNEISIPKGTYKDIMSYYPIRKQFPELYGIGDRGISGNAPALRQAQVKQLQAYLMPFDQLLVNFLTQLRNVYTLYDVSNSGDSSYFSENLPDIDELFDLINPVEKQYQVSEIKMYWSGVLKDLNRRFDDNALERLNEVTDQLLSRFSEVFQTYSLRKINSKSYGEAFVSERVEKELLEAKRKLVQEYASISYTRARSFNHGQLLDIDKQQNQFIPGAFRKIAILMEITDFRIKSVTRSVNDAGIRVYPKTLDIELILREIDISTPVADIEIVEIDEVTINEVIEENLYDVMHYVGSEDRILNEILKNGVIPNNYTIRKDPKASELYYVLYKRGDTQSNVTHIAKSEKEASSAIQKAVDYLIDVNHKSEGFFVVEHLLLLPPYHGSYFGFHIDFSRLSKELEIEIQHHELTSCQKRDDLITTIIDQLFADELQFVSTSKNGSFSLEIKTSNDELLAISKTQYKTQDALQEKIKTLKNNINTFNAEQLEAIIECNVFYGEHKINERFFSFQMSFIAPSWPVRFQNENFQRMFENTVYEHTPIHIKSTIHWLDYAVMQLFETYYFKWLEYVQQKNTVEDQMHQAYQLITMLQELDNQYEMP